MPSLDKAFSDFLRDQRGGRSYAAFAKDLGLSESTLHRLINGDQSATLGTVEKVLQKMELSLNDIFGQEAHRKRTRRG